MSKAFFDLHDALVPPFGQAVSVQGEVVRSIAKMADEFVSNGFANWDDGYERLAAFALIQLTDGTFGPQTSSGISKDIEYIQAYARGQDIGDFDLETAFDRLFQAASAWCQQHPVSIPHAADPLLKR